MMLRAVFYMREYAGLTFLARYAYHIENIDFVRATTLPTTHAPASIPDPKEELIKLLKGS